MKRINFLLVFLFLVGCTPSSAAIETALAKTEAAIPTSTPTKKPTITPFPTFTPYPTFTPNPIDINILYSDDFSNANSGWWEITDNTGRFYYSNGQYYIKGNKSNQIHPSIHNKIYSDGVMNIDVRKVLGDNELTWANIFWRYVDDGNFYNLELYNNGYYAVFKFLKNEWIPLIRSQYSPFLFSLEKSNKITIAFKGDISDIYFNNNYVNSVTDSSFKSGKIGLAASSDVSSDVEVAYDNFIVYKYEASNPFIPSRPASVPTKETSNQETSPSISPTYPSEGVTLPRDMTITVRNKCPESHTVVFFGPFTQSYNVGPGKQAAYQVPHGSYSWTVDGFLSPYSPMDLYTAQWELVLCDEEDEED